MGKWSLVFRPARNGKDLKSCFLNEHLIQEISIGSLVLPVPILIKLIMYLIFAGTIPHLTDWDNRNLTHQVRNCFCYSYSTKMLNFIRF